MLARPDILCAPLNHVVRWRSGNVVHEASHSCNVWRLLSRIADSSGFVIGDALRECGADFTLNVCPCAYLADFMFPDSNDSPSALCKHLVISLGAFNVPGYFPLPVFHIRLRQFALAMGATVPETAVNKKSQMSVIKDGIRLSDNVIRVLAPAL